MIKVQVHPADEGGCGFYRVTGPAQALQTQGHDISIETDLVTLNEDVNGRRHVRDVLEVDADVVVLQRPLARTTFEAVAHLQRRGVAVVVEIDDDFHSIPVGHSCRRRGVWSPDRSPRWIRRACEQADLVTVTTPALADRYAPHGRVVVLPNMVPESYLNIPAHASGVPPLVGWTGSLDTHVGDLEATGGGVAAALRSTGARFHVIGTGTGIKKALDLDEHPSNTNGWTTLVDYPKAYAGLDIAIVPLADNAFNEAKSDLKGLEALSLGVPFVASSTGPYRGLVNYSAGSGIIADSPSAWRLHLQRLISERHVREDLAGRGRLYVGACRTIEGQAWRWAEAWSHAARSRRSDAVLA